MYAAPLATSQQVGEKLGAALPPLGLRSAVEHLLHPAQVVQLSS